MNAGCYKIVFSKRLGALVAVGEHTLGQGKAAGTGIRTGLAANKGLGFTGLGFVGLLKAGVASVAIALLSTGTATAAGLAPNALPTTALPTGAVANTGKVAISTQGAAMTIQQTTDKASVNWNAFNIGSGASVNVQQNSVNSVLLNRVVGNDPSQILGKLTANGQVVLVNPNGIVFGKDGSVAASAFTASTFGISEKDFANGKYNYTRNGSTAAVTVENGATLSATAPSGYVALIGASVDNQGAISTQGGSVVMAAGEKAALPEAMTSNVSVPLSGKVRLELAPSSINASVTNSGTITTEGGQVLMQAAALSDAVASVTHTGTIDTTGGQGGAVTLQADHGDIKVSGSVNANSTGAGNAGGDVVIGRDVATGVLAKTTDVSGAKLESQGGFVETSGEYLKTDGISVKAKEWLLDPNDIVIGSVATTGGSLSAAQAANGVSQILASDVNTALNAGTNVTIATSASATGGNGDITVNAAVSNTTAGNTLTLNAGRSVVLNNSITASNILLNAATGSVSSTGAGALTTTGMLTINSATTGTLSGAISGTGGLTKTGAGQTTLTGSNTYTGGTKVVAGTLQIGDGTNNSLIAPGTVDIASGATLDFKLNSAVTYGTSNTFTGTGTLKKSGSGALTWAGGAATFAMSGGLIDVQGGTLVGGSNNNEIWKDNKASLNVATGATFSGVEANIMVDALTGGGTVSSGYGTTYPYGLTVGVNNGSGTFSGSIQDSNGVAAKLTKIGSGTQTLSGTNTYTGTTTISNGTLQLGNAGTTGSIVSTSAITNNGILAINHTDALTSPFVLSNNISGTGKLVNQGTGTTKLMGTSTFSGGVTVSKGNIIIGNGGSTTPKYDSAVGTGVITLGDSNTGAENIGLYLDKGFGPSPISSPLSRTINVTNNGTGTVTLGGLKTSTSGAGWTSFGGPLNLSKSINFYDGTGDRTSLDGLVTGNGDITLTNGRSIMGSSVQNTFTGNYTVNSGAILQLNSALALSANNNLINNGETRLNGGQALKINGLSGSGTLNGINLGSGLATTVSVGNGVGGNFTYAGKITGSGPVLSLIKNGTGTQTLTGTNTYSGTTTINGGTLQIGDGSALAATLGAGAVTLTNGANLNYARAIATSIANSISGTGNVNATITGSSNALTVDNTISLTNGKINLVTDGNLTVNKAISTTDNTTSAIFLEAGKAIAAGTTTTGVGDVTIESTGSVTANNGRITFMTGSLASGSTLGVATGNNRYYSDEETTSYTASLGSTGRYAIYREAPTLTATFNNASKTYDGLTYAGNSGVSAYTGFVNGDTTDVVHSTHYTGNAEGAKNAGTYAISGNALSGLGYKVIYKEGALTINKANLALSGTRIYDASTTFAGQYLTAIGVAGETFAVTGSGNASNLISKNVQTAQKLNSVEGLTLGSSANGGLSNNYNALSTTASSVNIAKAALTATGNSSSVTYNGADQSVSGYTVSGLQGSDTVSNLSSIAASGATAKNAGTYTNTVTAGTETNYTVTTANGTLDIAKAALTATGNSSSVTYNGADQSVSGYTVSGLQGSDKVSDLTHVTASGATAKNAGSYTNTVTAGTETNYTVTTANGTLDIAKAALTATGNSSSVTYNGADQSVSGYTVSGLQGSDKVSDLTHVTASGATAKNAGTYTNTVTAGTETNYTVTTANGSLDIAKADLVLSGTRVYDASQTFAGQYLTATGVNGETFTVKGSGDVTNLNTKNAQTNQKLSSVTGLSLTGSNNGALSDNYNAISAAGSSVSVTAKELTLAAVTDSKVYDGGTSSSKAVNVTGTQTGDSITAVQSFVSKNVLGTNNSTLEVGAVTINDGNNGNNYTIGSKATAAGTITAKELTFAAVTETKVYDSSTSSSKAATVTGKQGDDTITATQAFANKNVLGTNSSTLQVGAVTINDGNNGNNYTIGSKATAAGTITAKELTFAAQTDTKVYDGGTGSSKAASVTGTQTGDTITAAQSYLSKNVLGANNSTLEVGAVTINDGNNGNNYTIGSKTSATGTITAKNATITGTTTNLTYNGAHQTQNAAVLAGFVDTDVTNNTVGATGLATGRNAGTYASNLSVTGTDKDNYNITVTNANLVVGKKDASISGTTTNLTYNGASQSQTAATLAGFVETDVTNGTVGATGVATGRNAGTYASNLSATGSDKDNYNITVTNKDLVIAKKDASITGTSTNVTYSGAGQTQNAAVLAGFVDADVSSGTVGATGVATGRNAGTYASNLSATGTDKDNYNITVTNKDLVIAKKDASITGTVTNVTYNGLTQNQNAAVLSGFIAADVANNTVSATGVATGRNAGTYASNLSATGTDKDNYNITVTNANLVVGKKDASINGTTTNVTYNGASQTQSAAVLAGFVDVDLSSGTVSATGLATGRNVGSYTSNLSATGTDASNYNVTVTNKDLVIDKKSISLSGITAANKTYDGTTAATVSTTGAVFKDQISGDVLTVSSTGTFSDKNVAAGKTVTLANTLGGADLGNYTVTNQVATAADISKKSITLDGITAANKTYDGTTAATITAGAIATGVANETLAVSGTGTFSDKNSADGKTVTVADVTTLAKTNGTGDWRNYNLTTTGSLTTTANIDKKNVTLDSITAANKVYDGTDTAVITSGSISTGVNNETLGISGKGKFADTAPGTNKVVTVADVTTLTKTNGTGDWNNYKLNSTGSKTTKATITAVPPPPPAPTPSPASTSSGSAAARVKIPLGSGNPFQLASVEMLVDEVCSASNLESCFCESSTVNHEVSICYEKK